MALGALAGFAGGAELVVFDGWGVCLDDWPLLAGGLAVDFVLLRRPDIVDDVCRGHTSGIVAVWLSPQLRRSLILLIRQHTITDLLGTKIRGPTRCPHGSISEQEEKISGKTSNN